jgi:hypothetical protein
MQNVKKYKLLEKGFNLLPQTRPTVGLGQRFKCAEKICINPKYEEYYNNN